MIFKSKYVPDEPEPNTNRTVSVFAWFPVFVSGYIVWFSSYEIMQIYAPTEYPTVINGKVVVFNVCKWVKVSKRLITK